MPGKTQEHEARAKEREERKYWMDAPKRRKEESKRLEAEDKERQEAFEKDIRRAFGR